MKSPVWEPGGRPSLPAGRQEDPAASMMAVGIDDGPLVGRPAAGVAATGGRRWRGRGGRRDEGGAREPGWRKRGAGRAEGSGPPADIGDTGGAGDMSDRRHRRSRAAGSEIVGGDRPGGGRQEG